MRSQYVGLDTLRRVESIVLYYLHIHSPNPKQHSPERATVHLKKMEGNEDFALDSNTEPIRVKPNTRQLPCVSLLHVIVTKIYDLNNLEEKFIWVSEVFVYDQPDTLLRVSSEAEYHASDEEWHCEGKLLTSWQTGIRECVRHQHKI